MSVTNLIVGGSSGLGKALAYEYAHSGQNLILVARDSLDLAAICSDLKIRFNVQASFIACDIATDLFDEVFFYNSVKTILHENNSTLASLDLVAGGAFELDDGVPAPETVIKNLNLNFLGPVKIANIFLKNYSECLFNKIIFVSSIACIRPRKSNIAYTAAKTALESYALSLRHSVFQKGIPVNIQLLRLGYMESQFTRGKALPFPVARAEQVARYLVKNQNEDLGLFYFPHFWFVISLILRLVPWKIYRKMNF